MDFLILIIQFEFLIFIVLISTKSVVENLDRVWVMINDSFSHEKLDKIIIFLYAIKENVELERDFDGSVNGK